MKNLLRFAAVVAVLIVSLVVSCQKAAELPTNQDITFPAILAKSLKTDGNLTLTTIGASYSGTIYPNVQIDALASFFDKSGKRVAAQTFQINDIDIPDPQTSLSYYGHFSESHPDNNLGLSYPQIGKKLFGSDINVVVKSTDFGDVTAKMHSPASIIMGLPDVLDNEVDIKKPVRITYNTDPIRSPKPTPYNQVGAAVIFYANYFENKAQSNLPKENITIYKLADEATGEITFTPQELSVFPKGGFIMIYTGRAEQTAVSSSKGHSLSITSLVVAASGYLEAK